MRDLATSSRGIPRRRLTCLAGLLAAGVLMLCSPAAWALSGRSVTVGTQGVAEHPSVAVTSAGAAVIAWADTTNPGSDTVKYCALAPGGSSCLHQGTLVPAGGNGFVDNVSVISDGPTLYLLADVFGGTDPGSPDYQPEQEWVSSDGGATFAIVNGGLSVANGVLGGDTVPVNAVVMPGSGALGYGWETASGPPTFNTFPESSPTECSRAGCAAGFATLEPASNPDQVSNSGGGFAAQTSSPGILGVFATDFTSGPLGCSTSLPFGTAFAYGAGAQSSTNNYNISPGSPGSAWVTPVTQADCDVENPAVAGGPAGFGVLEYNDGSGETVYHRFDQATSKFDTAPINVAKVNDVYPSLTQDGAGGVYGTFVGGANGPIQLVYSSNAGSTWAGPVTLNPAADAHVSALTSSVNGAGQGFAAWVDRGAVIAQAFSAADAGQPAVTSSTAITNGQTVNVSVSCSVFPCTVTVVLSGPSTVLLHAASLKLTAARAKALTLGNGKLTITKAGMRALKIKLSATARRLLKSKKHGSFKVKATITTAFHGRRITAHKTLKIAIKR